MTTRHRLMPEDQRLVLATIAADDLTTRLHRLATLAQAHGTPPDPAHWHTAHQHRARRHHTAAALVDDVHHYGEITAARRRLRLAALTPDRITTAQASWPHTQPPDPDTSAEYAHSLARGLYIGARLVAAQPAHRYATNAALGDTPAARARDRSRALTHHAAMTALTTHWTTPGQYADARAQAAWMRTAPRWYALALLEQRYGQPWLVNAVPLRLTTRRAHAHLPYARHGAPRYRLRLPIL